MTYAENLEKAQQLTKPTAKNIQVLDKNSFWINDERQSDSTFKMEISEKSVKNWLKITQEQGKSCAFLPIDGNDGVFVKLVVQNPERFIYEWTTADETKYPQAGDCDLLLLNEKWHFIEFKTNATTVEDNQMTNNRNKGEAQLARATTAFKEMLNDETLDCVCVLVVPKIYPSQRTQIINRATKFFDRFGSKLIEISNDGNKSYALT